MPPISFDTIPNNLRTPGGYMEFNNELAGATSQEFQAVMFGQRLAAGTVAAHVPTKITDPAQAVTAFGRGSMLATMATAWLLINSSIPLLIIASDDLLGGQAAVGSIIVNTAATGAGALYLYLGDIGVPVGIASGDATTAIAISIAAAINANLDLPVTAAVDGGNPSKVNITARHKGEVFNGFNVSISYYGEAVPAGVTVTCASLTGGSGNPDATGAIDAMGDEWFNWGAFPYNDSANLTALKDELNSRWGAMRMIGCRTFACVAGTQGTMSTFGGAHNSPHLTVIGSGKSPTPSFVVAAINAAVGAAALAIDPARQLNTLILRGMKAPTKGERLKQEERNMLLYDGISTFTVDRDGTCRIERQITTYQVNAANLADASYLDITTPETLERIRYEQRAMVAQKYPRHKLASDGTQYGAGQAIVTPKLLKGDFLALYRDFEQKGWCEDFEAYAASLIIERDVNDRNRTNWLDHPNLINQAMVFAGKNQFIL